MNPMNRTGAAHGPGRDARARIAHLRDGFRHENAADAGRDRRPRRADGGGAREEQADAEADDRDGGRGRRGAGQARAGARRERAATRREERPDRRGQVLKQRSVQAEELQDEPHGDAQRRRPSGVRQRSLGRQARLIRASVGEANREPEADVREHDVRPYRRVRLHARRLTREVRIAEPERIAVSLIHAHVAVRHGLTRRLRR